MSEFLKENPLALRHCILYEFLQKEPVRKACYNFHQKFPKNDINLKEFQFWFDQFSKGKFSKDDQPISDMTTIFREDKNALRTCIFYSSLDSEYMKKTKNSKISDPLFNSYKEMCKVIGDDDVIDYPNFTFWFYRFKNGLFDLEMSEEDKKMLTLMDMPKNAMEKIGENLNYYERATVRKVSRHLRNTIDSTHFNQNEIFFNSEKSFTTLSIGPGKSSSIKYQQKKGNCHVAFKKFEREIKQGNHLKIALHDLGLMFKNPKFELNLFKIRFSIDQYDANFEFITDFFKSFRSEIHVKSFSIGGDSEHPIMAILPFMKPGVLQKIILLPKFKSKKSIIFQKIKKLEQWKQANHINITISPLPVSEIFRFEKFDIYCYEFAVGHWEKIQKALQKRRRFISGAIRFSIDTSDDDDITDYFGPPVSFSPETYHYSVPNSKRKYEIKLSELTIFIDKV